jgi:hypothetical protein
MMNLNDGENNCSYYFDAEMVLFDTNSDVNAFIDLLKTGENLSNVLDKNIRNQTINYTPVVPNHCSAEH